MSTWWRKKTTRISTQRSWPLIKVGHFSGVSNLNLVLTLSLSVCSLWYPVNIVQHRKLERSPAGLVPTQQRLRGFLRWARTDFRGRIVRNFCRSDPLFKSNEEIKKCAPVEWEKGRHHRAKWNTIEEIVQPKTKTSVIFIFLTWRLCYFV